ncbi:unnamed protein product [Mytilus edulis]|uniref:Uncharacterized protein n=1 Tax=Mytilus edulis TaxID=6550 RepID=A0A8S3V7I1_MYTED|nr:unnamed protein product [Mytilus edulis]
MVLLSSRNSTVSKLGGNDEYTTELHLNNNIKSIKPTLSSSFNGGSKGLTMSMFSNAIHSTINIPANINQTMTSRWIENKTRSYLNALKYQTETISQNTMTETLLTSLISEINDTVSSGRTNTHQAVNIKPRRSSQIQQSVIVTTENTPSVGKLAQQIINCDLLRNLGYVSSCF